MNQHLRDALVQIYINPLSPLPIELEDTDELLTMAKQEKLFPDVYEYISQYYTVSDEHQQFYQICQNIREEALRFLDIMATNAFTNYILIKGIGLESYYPSGMKRYFIDVDVCVPTVDELWELGNLLLSHGMEQKTTMAVYSHSRTHQIHGSARFGYYTEIPPYILLEVEVQTGMFPMAANTHLPWGVFVRQKKAIQVEGRTVLLPDVEGSLLILLAELIDHSFAPLREVLDIFYLLQDDQSVDFAYVAKQVKKYHLQRSIYLLREAFVSQQTLHMTNGIEQLFDMTTSVAQTKEVPDMEQEHVKSYLRTHSNRPRHDWMLYKLREWTNQLNDQDRFLRLLKLSDLVIGPKPFFNNGVYVYFLRIHDIAGSWQWYKIGCFHVVRTPIGSYVACLHALYSDQELDMLAVKLELHEKE